MSSRVFCLFVFFSFLFFFFSPLLYLLFLVIVMSHPLNLSANSEISTDTNTSGADQRTCTVLMPKPLTFFGKLKWEWYSVFGWCWIGPSVSLLWCAMLKLSTGGWNVLQQDCKFLSIDKEGKRTPLKPSEEIKWEGLLHTAVTFLPWTFPCTSLSFEYSSSHL